METSPESLLDGWFSSSTSVMLLQMLVSSCFLLSAGGCTLMGTKRWATWANENWFVEYDF